MEKSARISYSKSKGFALAEVVVALFIATIAIALVAGLGQQVMDLAKRSSQTGTVLELRSMVNSISRNPTTWIEKMRGSVNLQGLYAGCIPDPKLNISTFLCPDIAPDLLANDKELATIAGSGFYASSAPIINSNGELIAGTVENPVYLTSDGRLCEKGNCAFKSTGYFLRSNDKNNKDPGSVKFVIKVEKNKNSENNAPMKPQYLSIHIGEEWKSFDAVAGGVCPAGSIKVGYLSNGSPSCLNPSSKCTGAGQYSIGTDSAGNAICKTLPTSCPANSGYALNSAGNDLVCATSTAPCGENNIFLGYYGGSGEPMCSGSEIKCQGNQLQVGITVAAGKMTAECAEAPPSCTDANKRLAYDGEKFVCDSAVVAISCAANQSMTGINSDGTPSCVDRVPANINDRECASGFEMFGLDSSGKVKCRASSGQKFYPVAGSWPVIYSGVTTQQSTAQQITLPDFPPTTGPVYANVAVGLTLNLPLNSGCTQAHGTGWLDFNATHLIGTGGRDPFAYSYSHNVMVPVTPGQNTITPIINTAGLYCTAGPSISATVWLIGYTY